EPEPEEGSEQTPRPRDLEDAEPSAGTQHAPELPEPNLEVGDVAHAEADGRGVERAVREGQGEQIAAHPLDLVALAPRPLEHRLREVEAHNMHGAGSPGGEREVAGSATAVEDPVARADDSLNGQPSPAPVQPGGH